MQRARIRGSLRALDCELVGSQALLRRCGLQSVFRGLQIGLRSCKEKLNLIDLVKSLPTSIWLRNLAWKVVSFSTPSDIVNHFCFEIGFENKGNHFIICGCQQLQYPILYSISAYYIVLVVLYLEYWQTQVRRI